MYQLATNSERTRGRDDVPNLQAIMEPLSEIVLVLAQERAERDADDHIVERQPDAIVKPTAAV